MFSPVLKNFWGLLGGCGGYEDFKRPHNLWRLLFSWGIGSYIKLCGMFHVNVGNKNLVCKTREIKNMNSKYCHNNINKKVFFLNSFYFFLFLNVNFCWSLLLCYSVHNTEGCGCGEDVDAERNKKNDITVSNKKGCAGDKRRISLSRTSEV